MAEKPPPTRRRYRVTTGCDTCRQRHVKCDERKPQCVNCSRKNRSCQYRQPPQVMPTQLPNPRHQSDCPGQMHQSRQRVASPGSGRGTIDRSPLSSYSASSSRAHDIGMSSAGIVSIAPPSPTFQSNANATPPGNGVRRQQRELDDCVRPNEHYPRTGRSPTGSKLPASIVSSVSIYDGHSRATNDGSDTNGVLALEMSGNQVLDDENWWFGFGLASVLNRTNLTRRNSVEPSSYVSDSVSGLPQQPPAAAYNNPSTSFGTYKVDHDIPMSHSEAVIFRNYIERLSNWVDSFTFDRPFYLYVPRLARRCPSLLNACLAVSAKQLSLLDPGAAGGVEPSVAMHYYKNALEMMRISIEDDDYVQSDELFGASVILSTYEMLDVTGEDLGRHLKGISSLLQSHNINGASGGIKEAAFWTWYRQEAWAALVSRRRLHLDKDYWEPEDLPTFDSLRIDQVANRVIFLFGQCVSFCFNDSSPRLEQVGDTMASKSLQIAELVASLEAWKAKVPSSFSPVCVEDSGEISATRSSVPVLWFTHPQCGVAIQVYYASKILLTLYGPQQTPPSRGVSKPTELEHLRVRRSLKGCRDQIIGVALSGIAESCSLVSTQCLYIAGFITEGAQEQNCIIELIEDCQNKSGRRTIYLADELRNMWQSP